MATTEEPVEKAKSKKIFLNNIDSFQGRNIGKYLSQSIIGATAAGEKVETADNKVVSSSAVAEKKPREGFYEIVGTVRDKEKQKPDFAKEILQYETQEQLYEYLVECDIIIYDITENFDQISEAIWIITEMNADLDKIEKPKIFILISTCMTWDKTKAPEKEENTTFTEEDYRKRKPHPTFKEHINAEKTVLKIGKMSKHKLMTYVICSGLTYGAEENTFHYLFKSAWHNAPELFCFGNGLNVIPTIHIKDLVSIIQHIADGWSKYSYIIAKDHSQTTLQEIVKAISDNLGSKKVKHITKEEAFEIDLFEQANFEMMLVNLRMESLSLKNMAITWEYEAGIVENINRLITDYKESRNLRPLRAVILGPPASGKSTVASKLCEFYKLHHILIKDIIDMEIESLRAHVIPKSPESEKTEKDEKDIINDAKIQQAKQLLLEINESKARNNGRLEDKYIISFLRKRLMSMPCQNQGFILDGYPKTISQAQELFSSTDIPGDETVGMDGTRSYNKNIMPEFVINLEANDNFLRRKVMFLPESAVKGTHNTEKGLNRRLREYWAVNTYDETVLNFFDELELHPEKIDATKDKSFMMKDTVEKIKKIFGNARNYGSTVEELERQKKLEEENRIRLDILEKKEKERQEAEEQQEKKEGRRNGLHEVKKQQFEQLEVQSMPLRNYLIKFVMPTLTQALMDCCKVRPDDPIDFLDVCKNIMPVLAFEDNEEWL